MVLQGMVNKLAKDEDKEKYARFLLRAYVEGSKMVISLNKLIDSSNYAVPFVLYHVLFSCKLIYYIYHFMQTKWCPAPDCTCAVEFVGDENYDVLCNCKFSFCWNVCWFQSPNDLAFIFMGLSDQVRKASSIFITVCSAPRKLIDQ
jgi:ariadne-1